MSELFPFINIPVDVEMALDTELPLYKDIGWDFKSNIPLLENNDFKVVEGKEAIKVWVYKALLTPRYQYPVYSWDYGSELRELVGKAYTSLLTKEEAKRYIKEALEINPYIKEIDIPFISFLDGLLSADVKINTVYGDIEVNI